MHSSSIAAVVAALGLLAGPEALAQELKTEDEKVIYTLGTLIGRSLGGFNLSKAELEVLKRGMTDQLTGKPLAVQTAPYEPKVRELEKARVQARAKAFLDKAAKEPGAQVQKSGLVFFDVKPGTGPSPKATDTVRVHYRGTLPDGSEFDSSYARGQPAEFPLNGVIPCWTEGLQKMKVGGKARLVCPASIAYGDRGSPPKIPPGAALVFEVELLEIVAK
jgi:FKBP-type peptidyl-prolyl cis-trans isomerase FkpA